LHTASSYSLLDNIVYCCNGRDVATVIVHGQIVVRDGKVMAVDETESDRLAEERRCVLMQKTVEKGQT
jgi:cytosine/adenosine deaminase-related metal-dependent hydrolase